MRPSVIFSRRTVARTLRLIPLLLRFFVDAYRKHWFATPAGAIAAILSTFGAASLMIAIGPLVHSAFAKSAAVAVNAVIAPLLAYAIYLSVYYYGMFCKERVTLIDSAGNLDRAKLAEWRQVVKYDYLAHVPSDIYLITLAGVMQAALEGNGTPIFWAVAISQFVDDFVTFLKEPAIWNGAKNIVAWEKRANTTVARSLAAKFTSGARK